MKLLFDEGGNGWIPLMNFKKKSAETIYSKGV